MRRSPAVQRQSLGFTLIELLIVVVIIAILAAVVVPMALSRMERSRQAEAAPPPAQKLAQAAPSARAEGAEEGASVVPPLIEDSEVRVKLAALPVLEGTRVSSRYDATFRGTFTVRNADATADTLHLHFPFPPGITEARDVSLRRVGGEGRSTEAEGARYGLDGIRWSGQVAPGERVRVEVSYAVRGQEAFIYDVAGLGTGRVRFEVEWVGTPRLAVPAESLQPTQREPGKLVWQFQRVVASRPLVVELPGDASPLGRLILLCQLAALGVLLFGGGFWYLAELRRPGSLDDFRWGHFLLLALNYSLFFVAFAVVGYRGGLWLGLGVASLVGLPLLGLHVTRLSDVRFAWGRVLPWAMVTLGVVVAAAYAEEWRAHVLLGMGVAALAFVTPTWRSWDAGRQVHRRARREAREREARAREWGRQWGEVDAGLRESEARRLEARRSVETPAEGLERAWEEVGAALARLEAAERRLRELAGAGEEPSEKEAREAWVKERQGALRQVRWEVETETTALDAAIQRLKQRQGQVVTRKERSERALPHCMACGTELTGRVRFCPECGTPGCREVPCAHCGEVLPLPSHVLRSEWEAQTLHCRACGEALSPQG